MSKPTYQFTSNGCLTSGPPVLSRANGFRVVASRSNFLGSCRILQHLIRLQFCISLNLYWVEVLSASLKCYSLLLDTDSPTFITAARTCPSSPSINCFTTANFQKLRFTLSSFTMTTSPTAIVGPFTLVLFRWCSRRLSR